MATGIIPLISPQTHRRIDQVTFPGLLAASLMARQDRRAGAVILMTAAVEGVAHLTTDYPPATLPLMSFRTHNRVAMAHGVFVIALGLMAPGISRRGRLALCALGTMPITLAALSDTREPQSGEKPRGQVSGPQVPPDRLSAGSSRGRAGLGQRGLRR
jgi:hypothetical protein